MAYSWALDPKQKLWKEALPVGDGRQGNELKVKSILQKFTHLHSINPSFPDEFTGLPMR